jgi:hypothetical protein
MRKFHLPLLLSLTFATGLSLSSCKKDTPTFPTILTPKEQLAVGSWRLDEFKQGGQVSTGNAIKDRYSLTFRADGTYTQKILADNTTYPGTWALVNDNTVLNLTDHKGTTNRYPLTALSATELSYIFITPSVQTEERKFSAQP